MINPVAKAYTVRMNNGEFGPRDIGNHIDRGGKAQVRQNSRTEFDGGRGYVYL